MTTAVTISVRPSGRQTMHLTSAEFHLFIAMHRKGFTPMQVANRLRISYAGEAGVRFLACRKGILPRELYDSRVVDLPMIDCTTIQERDEHHIRLFEEGYYPSQVAWILGISTGVELYHRKRLIETGELDVSYADSPPWGTIATSRRIGQSQYVTSYDEAKVRQLVNDLDEPAY